MSVVRANGVELFYEVAGSGQPLVLVHGSWVDHLSWSLVVPGLAESFQVVTYDRRGHSSSERPDEPGSRRQDEDDLAALVQELDLAPAHIAGNSFGAAIVIGLAARRPELFGSLVAHEPPLMAIIEGESEVQPVLNEFTDKVTGVVQRLEAGDIEGGSRQFVEEIAVGRGGWDAFPPQARETFMNNAFTWVDEIQSPHWNDLDLPALSRFPRPVLLTQGDQSYPWFPKIVARLNRALPAGRVHTYQGAGHIPHFTHPDDYVRVTTEFIRAAQNNIDRGD